MCGICGFTGNTDNREETLTRMMNRIVHRGPDSAGKHISDGIAMGFRRLAIIDLNSGDQPMYNEDKTLVVTFNGEIYNYKELRKTLEAKGHIFSNNADTEVLLHGYEEYGPALVDMLRGMFSFVLWDTKTKTLFGARDPFGIKPFYYAPLGNDLAYGSEIKSILEHPSYQKKVNPEALAAFIRINGEGPKNEDGEVMWAYGGMDVFQDWVCSLELVDGQGKLVFPGHAGQNGYSNEWAEFLYPYLENIPAELYLAPLKDGAADMSQAVRVK